MQIHRDVIYILSNCSSNSGQMSETTGTVYVRSPYKSQTMSVHRARIGCTTSAAKSLGILRQTLQTSVNNEINQIIHRYIDKYFRPAIENIKQNCGSHSVSEQHVQSICRQLLEEAKKMYYGGLWTRSNSPTFANLGNSGSNLQHNQSLHGECGSDNENIRLCEVSGRSTARKRPKCDSGGESDSGLAHQTLKPATMRKKKFNIYFGKHSNSSSAGKLTPMKTHTKVIGGESVKREGRRWDPNRLSVETKFVLGSKANKALGFGMTRGRLYTKHPDVFRYIGDQEDKQWLHEHNLMPPAGGRAYLLIKEDIEDLINSDEYKAGPGVNAKEMGVGFHVPEVMIHKMKLIMSSLRTDDEIGKQDFSAEHTTGENLTPYVTNNDDNYSSVSSNQHSIETTRTESRVSANDDCLRLADDISS